MLRILLLLFLFSFGFSSQAQDAEIIERILSSEMPEDKGERVVYLASQFLGKPYIAGSLEGAKEVLKCRLDGFDCYTLVETVTALYLCDQNNTRTYADFLKMMQTLRYRDGTIDGYTSRIHYFFEWAKMAEENGFLQDLSPTLGVDANKNINFMSTHRQYYPAFKTNNAVLEEVKIMEEDLADYPMYYLPKSSFESYKDQLKHGDLIAFSSNLKGLDVNHEGIIYWKEDDVYFLHASSEDKKVMISNEKLIDYMNRIKKHSGLMVLRMN